MNTDELKAALRQDNLASYVRLRGGFPIPLAGTVYWAALGIAGSHLELKDWVAAALWGSGAIFPLALLFAAIFRNNFMKDKTAASGLLAPVFIGVLLFWPMAVAALWTYPELFPLILAIGMSLHWPAIGWMYGRTALFCAHAIIRAALVFYIWVWMPEHRLTLLPFAVAAVYAATVVAIIVDSGFVRARLKRG